MHMYIYIYVCVCIETFSKPTSKAGPWDLGTHGFPGAHQFRARPGSALGRRCLQVAGACSCAARAYRWRSTSGTGDGMLDDVDGDSG